MNDDGIQCIHCDTYDDHKIKHIRRRLENDDPRLVKLSIGIGSYEPPDGDWERDGRSVGANTNLKTLVISGDNEDYRTGEESLIGRSFIITSKHFLEELQVTVQYNN